MTNTTPLQQSEQPEKSTIPTSTVPGLARVRAMARGALTRQWPTRNLTLCPPAYGAVVPVDMLDCPDLFRSTDRSALVIFLPDDVHPHLETLGSQAPQLRTHELVGFRKQEVYLSLYTAATNAALPLAVWVRTSDFLDKHLSRLPEGRSIRVPVLFVAGSEARSSHWSLTPENLGRIQSAVQASQAWESKADENEKQRSLDVATRYGERPWLFMRYDIKNLGRRYATGWAPVCTIQEGTALEYLLD
jgi:hypothetical protein